MPQLLPTAETDRLRGLPLTYEPCGDGLPTLAGAHVFERSHVLTGWSFADAGEVLMTWGVHERAGLTVQASSKTVDEGVVVVLSLGPAPVALRAPCRVVRMIREPSRIGFAYGTLVGHPESGEEEFVIESTAAGTTFTVAASSRPASLLARAGGPLTGAVQRWMTTRYLRAFVTSL
ncbi:DUF1990 family protein [Luteipulveratus halotolerans]|uniref:DUF1990 domain-containing protein n=1 Tax=Luteipulveratus halotolerans TaxID=1631356 RepID=A0A0L6CNH2_9MICO|nr:DUF1990 domain-containing protein [Luteipulveratus halotolerans]KNX39068.1 hypothetical protein VV01_21175 [Luteipulveratus halotolerans]